MMVAESISFPSGHTGHLDHWRVRTCRTNCGITPWRCIASRGRSGLPCTARGRRGCLSAALRDLATGPPCRTRCDARGCATSHCRPMAATGHSSPARAAPTMARSGARRCAVGVAARAGEGIELEAERTLLARLQACAGQWPADPSGPPGDWLQWLVPEQARGHDALNQLRAVANGRQEADGAD